MLETKASSRLNALVPKHILPGASGIVNTISAFLFVLYNRFQPHWEFYLKKKLCFRWFKPLKGGLESEWVFVFFCALQTKCLGHLQLNSAKISRDKSVFIYHLSSQSPLTCLPLCKSVLGSCAHTFSAYHRVRMFRLHRHKLNFLDSTIHISAISIFLFFGSNNQGTVKMVFHLVLL